MVSTKVKGLRYWHIAIETKDQGDILILNPNIISKREGEALAMNMARGANLKVWSVSVTSRTGKAYRS